MARWCADLRVQAVVLGALVVAGCSRTRSSSAELGPGDVFHARDEQGSALELRIDTVERDPRDDVGDYALYGLSVRRSDGTFAAYCEPDADGLRRAIPVRGAWDAKGNAVAAPGDATTIACTNGAIAKCIRMGYAPWREAPGRPMKALHQACTRMIRADYCGDGRSHTRDGTVIDAFDARGIRTRAEVPGHPEVLEAAWGPDGAVWVNVPRGSDDVAALVAECPEKLRGRTSLDEKLTPDAITARWGSDLVMNGRFVADADRMAPKR